VSRYSENSEILEIDILEKFLTIEILAQEEISSREVLSEQGYQHIGTGWVALTECAVKSKLDWSKSLSPARFGFFSIGEDGGNKWRWSDQDIRRIAERVINERFLNPKRRQHALFLSMVAGSPDASIRHLYNLICQTLSFWLEDMTEATHDENIFAALRRILSREYKIKIESDNGVPKDSVEHHAMVKELVDILSQAPQDWKPLPSITSRGTPRKAKKGPFTMKSVAMFAAEISRMKTLPNKSQIYQALSIVLPKREGTASHRNEIRRVIFTPLDLNRNFSEEASPEDRTVRNGDELDSQKNDAIDAEHEYRGIEAADTEMEVELVSSDPFDKISSSNDESLAIAARALLSDLTPEEHSVLKEAQLENFDNFAQRRVVEELLAKIRSCAEQYWVKENDLLLEAAFCSEES
jgi:hypothetical protein